MTNKLHAHKLGRLAIAIATACALATALALAGCAQQAAPQPEPEPIEETEAQLVPSAEEPEAAEEHNYLAESSAVERPAIGDPEVANALTEAIESTAPYSGMDTCVSAIDLTTGTQAGYRTDEPMISASMIKLAVAYAFLDQVRDGVFDLDDTYVLEPNDIVGGTGSLGGWGAGAGVTYRELAHLMISESDNTATNVLIETVGMDAINETADRLGLTGTQVNRLMMDEAAIAEGIENYVSAGDVAMLLQMAYDGTFVDEESSKLVMDALEDQVDSDGILAGLPDGTVFAHKTGALTTVRHDGGIAETDRPFVLVVLCGGEGFSEGGAEAAMAEVAQAVYAVLA